MSDVICDIAEDHAASLVAVPTHLSRGITEVYLTLELHDVWSDYMNAL